MTILVVSILIYLVTVIAGVLLLRENYIYWVNYDCTLVLKKSYLWFILIPLINMVIVYTLNREVGVNKYNPIREIF